jgi:hypothetical protein
MQKSLCKKNRPRRDPSLGQLQDVLAITSIITAASVAQSQPEKRPCRGSPSVRRAVPDNDPG